MPKITEKASAATTQFPGDVYKRQSLNSAAILPRESRGVSPPQRRKIAENVISGKIRFAIRLINTEMAKSNAGLIKLTVVSPPIEANNGIRCV